MSRSLTNLLGIIITILAGMYFYVNYCSSCRAEEVVTTPVVEMPETSPPEASQFPFAMSSGNFSIKEEDNFNFNLSSHSILTPLSADLTTAINQLGNFLSSQEGNVLHITGFYSASETNNSAFPNLGLARANAVKNHLVDQGFSSALLNTFGELKDNLVPDNNRLLGPVGYSLSARADNADEMLEELYNRIIADPLVLNFNTAEASISLSEAQRSKFADISAYLDKVPSSTCQVIGHTDNTGQRSTNIRLGQERADFAKNYLISNGINASRIVATSQGPDVPIADNSTEEGRSQNRRTVITIKK